MDQREQPSAAMMNEEIAGRQCVARIHGGQGRQCFNAAAAGSTYCEDHLHYGGTPEERKAVKDRHKQKAKAWKVQQKAELDAVISPIQAVRHQLSLKSVQGRLSSSGLPKALRDALDALAAIPEDQVRKISLSLWGRS